MEYQPYRMAAYPRSQVCPVHLSTLLCPNFRNQRRELLLKLTKLYVSFYLIFSNFYSIFDTKLSLLFTTALQSTSFFRAASKLFYGFQKIMFQKSYILLVFLYIVGGFGGFSILKQNLAKSSNEPADCVDILEVGISYDTPTLKSPNAIPPIKTTAS